MVKGLYTAYTGMINEQNRMDTLTNNLANVTTVGYKKEGTTSQAFKDVLTLKIKDTSIDYKLAQPIGYDNRGVKIGENYVDWSQGSMRITNQTYDLALSGEGFFAIDFTNKAGMAKTMYTRAGDFTIDQQGFLVTNDGDFVLDTNGQHIKVDPLKDTSILTDGTITQNGAVLAKIQIADFADYNYLEKYGETYYYPVDGAEMKPATASVISGYLEMANVSPVSEMVNLIAISRQYESNQKIIQTIDNTLDKAVNQVGRV